METEKQLTLEERYALIKAELIKSGARVIPCAYDGMRCDFIDEGRVYFGIIIGMDVAEPHFYWWHTGNTVVSRRFMKVDHRIVHFATATSIHNAPDGHKRILAEAAIELRNIINSLTYDITAIGQSEDVPPNLEHPKSDTEADGA